MNDEVKKEETKAEETKAEETKAEETKAEETKAEVTAAPADGKKPFAKKGGKDGGRGRKPAPRKRQVPEGVDPDLEERVVTVNRVAKVVKGGRRFSFSALIIVGDKKGNVGYGLGKAKEVPEAIRKGTQAAQKNMIHVPIEKGTIPHEILGKYDAGKILFKPAADGTGVKAAGACRSILELAGVHNVLTKSLRGNNPHNVVKATFDALKNLRSVETIAALRGKDPKTLRLK